MNKKTGLRISMVLIFLTSFVLSVSAATLFSDNFGDGNYNGWATYGGTWTVSGGALTVNSGGGYKAVASGKSFTKFTYDADLRITNNGEAGIIFRVTNPSTGADAFNGYYFGINAGTKLAVIGKMNGGWTCIATKNMLINNNTWYHLKVIADGTNIKCYVNDNASDYPDFDVPDSSHTSGTVGVRTWYATANFDNIVVADYTTPSGTKYTNSVLGGIADPHVLYYNNTFYLYGTNSNDWASNMPNGIKVYTSTNLVNWTDSGYALRKADSWGVDQFWAPDVIYYNGLFYMYYAVDEHLCVATSSSPLGPFTQTVKQPMHPTINEIDGHVFIDTDGKKYFYFVRFNNGNEIWCAELNSDMKTINESTLTFCMRAEQAWEKSTAPPMANINEGAFVLKRNNLYYLTYSANHYQSPDYGVGYATSSNPKGPWTKYAYNPIMKSNSKVHGAGHHCIIRSPNNSELFIVYHTHYSLTATEPRKLAIDRIKFTTQTGFPDVLSVWGPTITPQAMPQ